MMTIYSDEHFMKEALKEAHKALEKDEVPIGCVIVSQNRIISRGHNLTQQLNDVTAHAEMQAITAAANTLGGKYLKDCKIFVTIEPCPMCAAALAWSQISEVVFGAKDEKKGYSTISQNLLHPKTIVKFGVLEKECSQLVSEFFKNKRASKNHK